MLATHNGSNALFPLITRGISIMAAGTKPSCVAQRIIIKCLCRKGGKAADIHHRL